MTDQDIFNIAEQYGSFEYGDAQGDKRLAFARDVESEVARPLLERIAALLRLAETFKLEAQIHAQEARTANATIAEIYQLCSGGTGEPGNWNGADPVRQKIAALDANAHAEIVRLRTENVVLEAKLVQRAQEKITEEMHIAAVKVLHRASGVDGLPQRMLDAMRSAAPAAPEQQDHSEQHLEMVAQAPNAQQAEPYGNPMSERAEKLAADPVRGPRIEALREKLAQQAEAQEPFAYLYHDAPSAEQASELCNSTLLVLAAGRRPWCRNETPLFTRPQPAQLQALSEDELKKIFYASGFDIRYADYVQSALAAKNGAVLK